MYCARNALSLSCSTDTVPTLDSGTYQTQCPNSYQVSSWLSKPLTLLVVAPIFFGCQVISLFLVGLCQTISIQIPRSHALLFLLFLFIFVREHELLRLLFISKCTIEGNMKPQEISRNGGGTWFYNFGQGHGHWVLNLRLVFWQITISDPYHPCMAQSISYIDHAYTCGRLYIHLHSTPEITQPCMLYHVLPYLDGTGDEVMLLLFLVVVSTRTCRMGHMFESTHEAVLLLNLKHSQSQIAFNFFLLGIQQLLHIWYIWHHISL